MPSTRFPSRLTVGVCGVVGRCSSPCGLVVGPAAEWLLFVCSSAGSGHRPLGRLVLVLSDCNFRRRSGPDAHLDLASLLATTPGLQRPRVGNPVARGLAVAHPTSPAWVQVFLIAVVSCARRGAYTPPPAWLLGAPPAARQLGGVPLTRDGFPRSSSGCCIVLGPPRIERAALSIDAGILEYGVLRFCLIVIAVCRVVRPQCNCTRAALANVPPIARCGQVLPRPQIPPAVTQMGWNTR